MLQPRTWVPKRCEGYISSIANRIARQTAGETHAEVLALVEANRHIHERECINLNPATNVMNPRAEALLAAGLGTRVSLGYPGDKYETGLEAIEQIEVIAAELAAEVFGADFVEVRVPSGAMANLYVFIATAAPGDAIIAPPSEIGGHVTHHAAGAAGLYGLVTHPAPVDPVSYSIDVDALRIQARQVRPKLITVGGSLNLFPHPIRELREIAEDVGAWLLFDAAHMSGIIAGKGWPSPLEEGAHIMTMSTYKSLGGPPSGLIVTNEPDLAERIDAVAFPGLTANFDVAKTAALAITLLDWKEHGEAYAQAMTEAALVLAQALGQVGLPVFASERGGTRSHQLALEAARYGGGRTAARRLREGNILTSGIGLPVAPVPGGFNGIRFGTNEIVRLGMTRADLPELAGFICDALEGRRPLSKVAADVTRLRSRLSDLHYIRQPCA